jgi:hypothetical protein
MSAGIGIPPGRASATAACIFNLPRLKSCSYRCRNRANYFSSIYQLVKLIF